MSVEKLISPLSFLDQLTSLRVDDLERMTLDL